MLSTLVYQTLSNFAKLYGLYKKVKKNETLRYVTIGISVVAILAISVVLIMLREPVVKSMYILVQILQIFRDGIGLWPLSNFGHATYLHQEGSEQGLS